jgi:hypothetical protein
MWPYRRDTSVCLLRVYRHISAAVFLFFLMDRWNSVMAKIVIINPRFEISFWGLEHCMPLFGKRANLPVANLALLAALVPKHHEVTLIDENVRRHRF